MATLAFNKVGDAYVAEFETPADFNLHIEQEQPGGVLVYQRTAGAQYGLIKEAASFQGAVLDVDFMGGIFPKSIKVVCSHQPSVAIVTTNA